MLRGTPSEARTTSTGELRPAVCPRCRYDLSGTTRQWTDRCPLSGRCNECGLEFDWAQVFVLTEHPWLFEYHWRRGPIVRLLRTIWRSLRPWSFWRDVKMSDPVYLRPAAVVWITCLSTGLLAALGSIISGRHTMFSNWFGRNQQHDWAYWRDLVVEAAGDAPRIVWMRVSGALFVLVGMPIAFALLPTTLRRARVRRAHILRIWMYSLSFLTVLAIGWLLLEAVCDWLDLYAALDIIDPWRWYSSWDDPIRSAAVPGATVAGLATLWMMIFWYCAVRFYLRLRHAALVSISLGLIVYGIALLIETPKWWARIM